MKLIHLSDLHLGKKLNEFSLLEEQSYILDRICELIAAEKPDAVLISGDIYDKTLPPAAAVQLCDDFLCRVAAEGQPLLIISGNHDSAERISFGARLMENSSVYIAPVYDGSLLSLTLRDELGEVDFLLLPFIKPSSVRHCFPEETIDSYNDAVRVVLEHEHIDPQRRSVLLAHQFVTGAQRCDSEELSIGGLDNIDASLFDAFDYVALGHLHGAQFVSRPAVRYCGTPLKYSTSELHQHKSVTVAELGAKNELTVRTLPLQPLHDMFELRGTFSELTDPDCIDRLQNEGKKESFVRIVLTDENDIPHARQRLSLLFPRLLELRYDNRRTRCSSALPTAVQAEMKSPLTLFAELYERQNGQPLSEQQSVYLSRLITEIWEGGEK